MSLNELGHAIRAIRPELTAETAADPARPASFSDAALEAARDEAMRKAAVVGWFRPDRLVKVTDRALRERVLSEVVANCELDGTNHHLWRLRREPRRDVLTSLAADRRKRLETLRATASNARDLDTQLLRRVLRGTALKPASAHTDDERGSMLRVAEWTGGIFKNAPDPSEVRGHLARDAVRDSLTILVNRFHGRESELDLLERFVSGRAPRSQTRLPVLAISGIGGVGKSALLARFVDRLLSRSGPRRPAVVLIDFDRARFSSGDPLALTFELTRQVAAWFPGISEPLRQLRHEVRLNAWSSGYSSSTETATVVQEAVSRGAEEIYSRLHQVLHKAKIGIDSGHPLVLVLDTFEMLQGSGDSEIGLRGVGAVARWVHDLFVITQLRNLRVVVAGRAPIHEDPAFAPLLTEAELSLKGLDRAAALAVLREYGLSTRQAEMVVDAIGDPGEGTSNPLILRLAARLVKSGTVKADSLKPNRTGERTALDDELVQGILYRRILAHLGEREKDRALAALAHPGLVLRRVTPQLIEQVLIPHTELKKHRNIDARELFSRLRREVWLVRPIDEDTVEHRADLRRTMLKLIDADMRQQAHKIHRAAIRYYSKAQGVSAGADAHIAGGEALYHRLMLMDERQVAQLKDAEVKRYESSLHPNLDDFPPHVAAVVKTILDRPLTDREGLALPEPRRSEFVLRQGDRYVRNDEPYRALSLLEAVSGWHPLWELQALTITAQWQEVRERKLLTPLKTPGVSDEQVSERLNLVAWLAFCLGDSAVAHECALRTIGWLGVADAKWPKVGEGELLFASRAVTYRMLAARDTGNRAAWSHHIPWGLLRSEQITSTSVGVEATRHAIIAAREREWDARVVFGGEALPASARHIDALARSALPPELKKRLAHVAAQLRKLPARASSGHVLGTVARAFPKCYVVAPESWTELDRMWELITPNAEFRGPIKCAVTEAFLQRKELRRVAEAAASLTHIHPADLRPDVFAERASQTGRAAHEISTLVHFVDRSAVLPQFVAALRREKPKDEKLRLVGDAFRRWQRALDPKVVDR